MVGVPPVVRSHDKGKAIFTRRIVGVTLKNASGRKGAMGMDIQNILVPIDYSEDSQRALRWGASLAEKYGAKLLLLHVIPNAVEEVYPEGTGSMSPTPSYYEVRAPGVWTKHPIIIDRVDTAHTELRDVADQHLKDTAPVQVKVAVGKPTEEILRVAREEKVDLIIMGTHGRTGVRHLVLGSVAEAVTRQAPCPVLTVRVGLEAVA
jgi:nucleotide-binding universal stress UspA family protein